MPSRKKPEDLRSHRRYGAHHAMMSHAHRQAHRPGKELAKRRTE